MNVMIIENDKLMSKVISLLLVRAGHSGYLVENGKEALEVVNSNPVDLIICDLNIPEILGATFLKILRNFLYSGIPVIVISGVIGGERLLKVANVEYDYFLKKPINFDELADLIKLFEMK